MALFVILVYFINVSSSIRYDRTQVKLADFNIYTNQIASCIFSHESTDNYQYA